MRTDIEKALKCAPHAFGIAEAAFLGNGLDWCNGLFEFAAGRVGPGPFGKLRRRHSGFAASRAKLRGLMAMRSAKAGTLRSSPGCPKIQA